MPRSEKGLTQNWEHHERGVLNKTRLGILSGAWVLMWACPVDDVVEANGAPASRPAGGQATARATAQPKAITGNTFREALSSGGEEPEMVVIPAGRFRIRCLSNDQAHAVGRDRGQDCSEDEKPVHEVTITQPFAFSVHEVTFEDYDRFTYPKKVSDRRWGRGRRPVITVSWNDARDYVDWLSRRTRAEYRLPSEAEWEYAARAGTTTKYSWGDAIGVNRANCDRNRCGDHFKRTAPVGSFRANGFGLYDMHGNVSEWVADCWNESYDGAPADGRAWLRGDCDHRVSRGGAWYFNPGVLRAARRLYDPHGLRLYRNGFRAARTLTP